MENSIKSNKAPDLSLKTFVKHFAAEVFHLDSRIARTLYALFAKPGRLSLAYLQASEKKYIQPLKLYFAINFLFFLITPVLNTPQFRVFSFSMQSISGKNQLYQEIIRKQTRALGVSKEIYAERFNAHLKYSQPAFVFLIIPFFALLLQIVNFRNKRYYIEHLIFSLHFLSFFLLFLLITILLFRVLAFGLKYFSVASGTVGLGVMIAFLLWLVIYLAIATKTFYKTGIWGSLLKSIFLLAGFVVTLGGYIQFLFFYTILALKFGA